MSTTKSVRLVLDEDVLRKARRFAKEQGATLEELLTDHLAMLADRAGRHLTLREQIYVGEQQAGQDSKRHT